MLRSPAYYDRVQCVGIRPLWGDRLVERRCAKDQAWQCHNPIGTPARRVRTACLWVRYQISGWMVTKLCRSPVYSGTDSVARSWMPHWVN